MALPATESFTGTDFTFPPNANWSTLDGNIQILSNQADGVAADGNCIYWNVDTFNTNQYAQCVVSYVTGTGNSGPGVRLSGTTGYIAVADFVNDTVTLYRWDGDESYAQLGQATTVGLANGDLIRLEVRGSDLTVLRNGGSIITQSDGTYTGGSAGLFHYGSDSISDDWEGGNLSGSDPSFRVNSLRPNAFAPGLAR
jgi:hypothetical protein